MNESQLAEDVRVALDEATEGVRGSAGLAARARTRGRRRRAGRGLLAIVPAAAVISGVAVFAHGGGAPARGVTATPSPSATVQTDAYIARQVEAVLGNADNFVIATSADSGPGQVTTSYLDPVTGTTRSVVSGAGDKVTYWIQTRVSGNEDQWRTTYVDYTKHTWWTKATHSGQLGDDTSNLPVLNAQTPPAQISHALALGELRIGLKGQVKGHAAIELVYAGSWRRRPTRCTTGSTPAPSNRSRSCCRRSPRRARSPSPGCRSRPPSSRRRTSPRSRPGSGRFRRRARLTRR